MDIENHLEKLNNISSSQMGVLQLRAKTTTISFKLSLVVSLKPTPSKVCCTVVLDSALMWQSGGYELSIILKVGVLPCRTGTRHTLLYTDSRTDFRLFGAITQADWPLNSVQHCTASISKRLESTTNKL